MLETIREYAVERMEEDPGFSAATRWAHAAYFAEFSRRQWERLTGPGREAALAELSSDLENVRSAWSYWVGERDLDQLGKFIDSLWYLYDARGWYHATIDLTQDMLRVLQSAPRTAERIQQEILLQTSLARALQVIKGHGGGREEASPRLGTLPGGGEIQLFPVLRPGQPVWLIIGVRKARQMAEKIQSRPICLMIRICSSRGISGWGTPWLSPAISSGLDHLREYRVLTRSSSAHPASTRQPLRPSA
jgi:hypothetical protein